MIDGFETVFGPWAFTLAVAAGAAAATATGYALIVRIARRLLRRRATAGQFLEHCARPGFVLAILVPLQIVLHGADDGLLLIDAVRHLIALALILVLTWAALAAISAVGDTIVALNPATAGRHHVARKLETQARFLTRALSVLATIVGVSAALMTFPSIRQIGTSLLASAGIGGLIIGFAARPVLSNVLAGLQIAMTQPFRIEDVLKVQGEWCWVEEVTTTYVVLRIWDLRRLVVPLQWFIENPFENWTRRPTSLMGTVFIWLDYRVPVPVLRAEFLRLLAADGVWDELIGTCQLVDSGDHAIQLRFLMSAGDSVELWHLRCRMREALIDYIQQHYPEYLPNIRARVSDAPVPTFDGDPQATTTALAGRPMASADEA